jgi:imidazolonepropionase-like amidohydrolase
VAATTPLIEMRSLYFIACAAAVLAPTGCTPTRPAPRQTGRANVAILAARVFDPVAATFSGPAVVLVNGSRITDVIPASRFKPEMADTVIDLKELTVLPGLIDSHVHLGIGNGVRRTALADLEAGFTTVVDLGAVSFRILRVRDSINAGLIPGPRVLAAGLWIGIKGGTCEFNGIGVSGGPEQFRARVRENVAAGADVIKLCVTSWPTDAFANPDKFELPDDDLAAAIEEGHKLGRIVVAHDLSAAGVRAALRHGIDGLVHTAFADSATVESLARAKVFMIPTLASLTSGDTSSAARALPAALSRAYRAGVPIVFGTDAGVLTHGSNSMEFSAMVHAGISAEDALRSATINAARVWRLSDSVGIVAKGMVADIVAVSGDPLVDIGTMSRVQFVMARGHVVTRPQQ